VPALFRIRTRTQPHSQPDAKATRTPNMTVDQQTPCMPSSAPPAVEADTKWKGSGRRASCVRQLRELKSCRWKATCIRAPHRQDQEYVKQLLRPTSLTICRGGIHLRIRHSSLRLSFDQELGILSNKFVFSWKMCTTHT
jgi:hypothetical protein